jgi:hypothetical protein
VADCEKENARLGPCSAVLAPLLHCLLTARIDCSSDPIVIIDCSEERIAVESCTTR